MGSPQQHGNEPLGAAELGPLRQLLEGRDGLRLAFVFGSLAQGGAGLDSDLDIAVQADRPLSVAQEVELIELLAAACGRPVDLIDLTTVGEPLLGRSWRTASACSAVTRTMRR